MRFRYLIFGRFDRMNRTRVSGWIRSYRVRLPRGTLRVSRIEFSSIIVLSFPALFDFVPRILTVPAPFSGSVGGAACGGVSDRRTSICALIPCVARLGISWIIRILSRTIINSLRKPSPAEIRRVYDKTPKSLEQASERNSSCGTIVRRFRLSFNIIHR